MRKESSYCNYLQNQDFQSYPNNNKLRLKPQIPSSTPFKPSNPNFILKTSVSKQIEQKAIKKYRQPADKPQNTKQLACRPICLSNQIRMQYDPQELNKNVKTVLSSIQEIQSEFRKISNSNTLQIMNSLIHQQQPCQKPNDFQSLMEKIKNPVDYQIKSQSFIQQEKHKLLNLLKNLNKKLNLKLKKSEQAKFKQIRKESRVQSKLERSRRIKTEVQQTEHDKTIQREPSALEFEISLVKVVQEISVNNKLIENMKNQLIFLSKKYENYQKSLKNYKKLDYSIEQLKKLLQLRKQQISRIRKTKFLNEKSIINIEKRNGNMFFLDLKDILSTGCSTSTRSNDLLSLLKEQYSETLKKKEKIKKKNSIAKIHLAKIEQLRLKNNIESRFNELNDNIKNLPQNDQFQSNQKGKRSCDSLSKQSKSLPTKDKNKIKAEHIDFIYKARLSKLKILMNTLKRSQQSNKKKYYNLLKQYETMIEDELNPVDVLSESKISKRPIIKIYKQNQKRLDEKIQETKGQIISLQNKIERLSKVGKIKNIKIHKTQASDNSSHYQIHDQSMQYDSENQGNHTFVQNHHHQQNLSPIQQYQHNLIQSTISKQSRNILLGETSLSKQQIQLKYQKLSQPFKSQKQLSELKANNLDVTSKIQKIKTFNQENVWSSSAPCELVLNTESIVLDQRQGFFNGEKKRHIGKFKKQRFIEKIKLKNPYHSQFYDKYKSEGLIFKEQIQGKSSYETKIIDKIIQEISENKSSEHHIRFPQNSDIIQDEVPWKQISEIKEESELQKSKKLDQAIEQIQKQLVNQHKQEQMKKKFTHLLYSSKIFS